MKNEQENEEIRRYLDKMPFDARFNGEMCHATGWEVFRDGEWWNEYIDSEGDLWYGR